MMHLFYILTLFKLTTSIASRMQSSFASAVPLRLIFKKNDFFLFVNGDKYVCAKTERKGSSIPCTCWQDLAGVSIKGQVAPSG